MFATAECWYLSGDPIFCKSQAEKDTKTERPSVIARRNDLAYRTPPHDTGHPVLRWRARELLDWKLHDVYAGAGWQPAPHYLVSARDLNSSAACNQSSSADPSGQPLDCQISCARAAISLCPKVATPWI